MRQKVELWRSSNPADKREGSLERKLSGYTVSFDGYLDMNNAILHMVGGDGRKSTGFTFQYFVFFNKENGRYQKS